MELTTLAWARRAVCDPMTGFVAWHPDGTRQVRRKMKGELVKSIIVAAEVARDVRYDLHAGTPALKALRMILNLRQRAMEAWTAQRGALRHRGGVRTHNI